MADGIYVGMSGAVARAEQLDAIADNLANAQTPGFKAARPAFETFLPQNPSDLAFTAAVHTGIDMRPGATSHTGNPLDLTPEDGAFFAVRTPEGQNAFTRAGHVTVDSANRLVTGDHLLLNATGNPITVPRDTRITVSAAGDVMSNEQAVDQLARVKLEGPLRRMGPTLIVPEAGGRAVGVTSGVRSGELELGNANALEATVQLVNAQRNYETSMQAIQTYRRLDDRVTDLGRVR